MLDDRAGLRLVTHLDRDDAVIELLWRRPSGANVVWIARVNTDGKCDDPDNLQHRAHEVRFVFAVAVRLLEDLIRSVWTITTTATETGLNRDVLNVLYVLRDRANLVVLGFRERG